MAVHATRQSKVLWEGDRRKKIAGRQTTKTKRVVLSVMRSQVIVVVHFSVCEGQQAYSTYSELLEHYAPPKIHSLKTNKADRLP